MKFTMSKDISLADATEENAQELIKKSIDENQLLVFMKGNSNFPQCGFSAQIIHILNEISADYRTVNVLENNSIRENIKSFSNWPTIPQVYYKQEFVGGCDIVTEMYQNGELQELLVVAKA